MINAKLPILTGGFLLLILLNSVGGILLHKTYHHAARLDNNLLLQGEQIISSIVASAGDMGYGNSKTKISQLATKLLEIENVKATLFIDGNDQITARSGTNIPPSLLNTFKENETYGVRQGSLYYLSVPVTTSEYVSGPVTEASSAMGFVVLALDTASVEQQRTLLSSYFIGGAILLVCLNLGLLFAAISYGRRLNAYRNAPPEIRHQFARGYRQLKQSIALQQRAIEQARREAMKTSEIKSQFIANMSHEIRTPLNAILGFTDLLLKSKLDLRQRDFLVTIRKSSLGLLQIINDILDFSKIEAGKIALDEISIDLRETVEDVLAVMAPSAHEKQLELISIFAPDLPHQITADPLRLKQILTNLVSNAIKFTSSGSIAIRIGIEERNRDSATFKVNVSDTGIGIDREKQEQLFQAFAQVDTSTTREFGGSGLGLVIAKELVEQMKGNIGVNSQLGHGANFWFTFQAKLSDTTLQAVEFEPLQGRRIALFDKHPLVRMSILNLLTEWQAVTRSTGKLQELEQTIEQNQPSEPFDAAIISIDFNTTDVEDYRELLSDLKIKQQCPTLLLHYTVEDREDRAKLVDEATAAITKPIRSRELHQILIKLVGMSELSTTGQTELPEDPPIRFDRAPNVLVVDDNLANLKLVSTLLCDMGAEVTEATSGTQALERLAQHSFDIVYMDIQMPGMDGAETTRQIRRNPSLYRDVPIVALTAHALESEKSKLLLSGMDDYLSKPVTEQHLVDTILRWTDIQLKIGRTPASLKKYLADTTDTQPFELPDSERDNSTPVVDIPMSIELAAGKVELAQELFEMLLKSLGGELDAIRLTHKNGNHNDLLAKVHHLHGATRYCGVPALTAAAKQAEKILKQKQTDRLDQAVNQLTFEMEQVMLWAKANRWISPPN